MKISTTSCAVAGTERRMIVLSVSRSGRKTQVFEQELHQVAMPRIAHRLVVERFDAARQRFAQRAEAAGCVERFVFGAVEREMLKTFERLDPLRAAVADRLAGLAILVDQAVDTLHVRLYFRRVGRELGQRADAHLDVADFRETVLPARARQCADKAWRQAALRP